MKSFFSSSRVRRTGFVLLLVAAGLCGRASWQRVSSVLTGAPASTATDTAPAVSPVADGNRASRRDRDDATLTQERYRKTVAAIRRVGPIPIMSGFYVPSPPGDDELRVEMMKRVNGFDRGQAERFFTFLRADPELDPVARGEVLVWVLQNAGRCGNVDRLEWILAQGDLLEPCAELSLPRAIASGDLAQSLALNLPAGLETFAALQEKLPFLVTPQFVGGALNGVAETNPALAFQLVPLLKGSPESFSGIFLSAQRAGRVDSGVILEAFRGHLAAVSDPVERQSQQDAVLKAWGGSAAPNPKIDPATLDLTALSEEEINAFARGVAANTRSTSIDTKAAWLSWIASSTPVAHQPELSGALITDWVGGNPAEATAWVETTTDEAAREAALPGFVKAIACYDFSRRGQVGRFTAGFAGAG